MTTTIGATFDGSVLRPDRPLELQPNTHVMLTLTSADSPQPAESFIDVALGLQLDGPADWSENVGKYLAESRRASND